MLPQSHIAVGIARALLAGDWEGRLMRARVADAVAGDAPWIARVVTNVLARFPTPPVGFEDGLVAFLTQKALWREAASTGSPVRIRRWMLPRTGMDVSPVQPPLAVPPIATVGDLADRLGLDPRVLDWLSDLQGRERRTRDERLRNYSYRWMPKRRGGWRLIEAPKAALRDIQRRVLDEVLAAIRPHEAARAFRPGRSPLTNAAAHAGREVVIRFDLIDFFAHVSASRIHGIFRTAGYPRPVATVLTGLCTNALPHAVEGSCPSPLPLDSRGRETRVELLARLRGPHLPQGAPTSPALANLAAHALDRRLTGLARALGATYTRYADDLVFSGPRSLARASEALETRVAVIAEDEGFALNHRKTRVARASVRQRVTGLVVNEHPAVPRAERDRLEAILTNAVRHGLTSQNRTGRPQFRAHLAGRVAWVDAAHPGHGAKLRALLDRIPLE